MLNRKVASYPNKKSEASVYITSEHNMKNKVKASLTVEASFVLPLVLILCVNVLFIFRILQTQIQIEKAMHCAAKRLTVYACVEQWLPIDDEQVNSEVVVGAGEKILEDATAKLMVNSELRKKGVDLSYIKNGMAGIHFYFRDLNTDYLDMIAVYNMDMPIDVFHIGKQKLHNRVRMHKWLGDDPPPQKTETDEKYVYVTDNGTVYHTTTECKYLDLSIRSVFLEGLEDKRNMNGGKYYPCSKCAAAGKKTGMVYITNYGDRYHTSRSCSELKRTVKKISIKDVGSRGPCSNCGK